MRRRARCCASLNQSRAVQHRRRQVETEPTSPPYPDVAVVRDHGEERNIRRHRSRIMPVGPWRSNNQQHLPTITLSKSCPSLRTSKDSQDPFHPSILMDQYEDSHGNSVEDEENRQDKPRLTIRQLRQAAQKENLAKELAKANQPSQELQFKTASAAPKKKASLFGGLFQVREPTQIALNQVAAQMIAQHGSTSAMKVPNVRLERMPDFVPKVNTKWDGIPESAKEKEKKERDKAERKAIRESFFRTDSKSGSDTRRPFEASRNSSSTTDSSFGAYPNSRGSQGGSSHTRFYAQSVNSSGDLASQQRNEPSQRSGTNTSHSGNDSITDELANTQRWLTSTGSAARPNTRHEPDPTSPKRLATNRASILRSVSEYSPQTASDRPSRPLSAAMSRPLLSPTKSVDRTHPWEATDLVRAMRAYSTLGVQQVPRQTEPMSPVLQKPSFVARPVSPYFESEMSLQVPLPSSTPEAPRSSPVRKEKSQTLVADAFLAGEAQELVLSDDSREGSRAGLPMDGQQAVDRRRSRMQTELEKRPDSSRDRLGLRASMLVTDETPWEQRQMMDSLPPSPRIDQFAANAKTKLQKPFSKFGK